MVPGFGLRRSIIQKPILIAEILILYWTGPFRCDIIFEVVGFADCRIYVVVKTFFPEGGKKLMYIILLKANKLAFVYLKEYFLLSNILKLSLFTFKKDFRYT